jgi:hypothetical protein
MKWMKQGSKYFYWATKLTLLVHIRILDSTKKFVAYNDQKKIKIDVKLIWQLYGFLNSICLQAIDACSHYARSTRSKAYTWLAMINQSVA